MVILATEGFRLSVDSIERGSAASLSSVATTDLPVRCEVNGSTSGYKKNIYVMNNIIGKKNENFTTNNFFSQMKYLR